MITYEYPFNERIRTLLRLEDLFQKSAHFRDSDDPFHHHVALLALFETVDVAGRADLKVDLVQELERQRQILISFRENPDISEDALKDELTKIEQASTSLLSMSGRFGQHLRDNEWLASIRSRANIPGGACEFDLPSYHYWLSRDEQTRRRDLDAWAEPLKPVQEALSIVLRLLRSSGRPEAHVARAGAFSEKTSGIAAQMVRIRIARTETAVPEISANKYALNIRFMLPETQARPRPLERDLPFELTFCGL
ncbi:MAG: cell division protein ZapD [Azoarcus sp.]|nr:cell division protein ZapD [Azoarcus sp.]